MLTVSIGYEADYPAHTTNNLMADDGTIIQTMAEETARQRRDQFRRQAQLGQPPTQIMRLPTEEGDDGPSRETLINLGRQRWERLTEGMEDKENRMPPYPIYYGANEDLRPDFSFLDTDDNLEAFAWVDEPEEDNENHNDNSDAETVVDTRILHHSDSRATSQATDTESDQSTDIDTDDNTISDEDDATYIPTDSDLSELSDQDVNVEFDSDISEVEEPQYDTFGEELMTDSCADYTDLDIKADSIVAAIIGRKRRRNSTGKKIYTKAPRRTPRECISQPLPERRQVPYEEGNCLSPQVETFSPASLGDCFSPVPLWRDNSPSDSVVERHTTVRFKSVDYNSTYSDSNTIKPPVALGIGVDTSADVISPREISDHESVSNLTCKFLLIISWLTINSQHTRMLGRNYVVVTKKKVLLLELSVK